MQPELFEELQTQPSQRRFQLPSLFPHRFLRLRLAYEDVIFGSLSLILVLLAGFCFGVERGKRLTPVEQAVKPTVVVAVAGPVPVPAKNPSMPVIPVAAVSHVSESEPGVHYAIQLASYVDMKVAQAEVQRLRRIGFNSMAVKQGKYIELRVIGYRSRAEAMNSLGALRKMYHDGFVKRLSS